MVWIQDQKQVQRTGRKIIADIKGRQWSRSGRSNIDSGRNLHLYIEYIEGEKFPKNKLYTRYTQEHGQLKLSKKGK